MSPPLRILFGPQCQQLLSTPYWRCTQVTVIWIIDLQICDLTCPKSCRGTLICDLTCTLKKTWLDLTCNLAVIWLDSDHFHVTEFPYLASSSLRITNTHFNTGLHDLVIFFTRDITYLCKGMTTSRSMQARTERIWKLHYVHVQHLSFLVTTCVVIIHSELHVPPWDIFWHWKDNSDFKC